VGSPIELSKDTWTIRQLIEQVTDISQNVSNRGVELVIHVVNPKNFNTTFVGDYFRLRQCCINLVDNAIKYSANLENRDALVKLSVEVVAKGVDVHAITFTVDDNGVGIPANKQHTLFVPFCQPADNKEARDRGTGLGLVITKSIIECMGGTIGFKSVEGEGTTFFFTVDFPESKDETSRKDGDGDVHGARGDFVVEAENTLPDNARIIFHPEMNKHTKKHVTNILNCFGWKGAQEARILFTFELKHSTTLDLITVHTSYNLNKRYFLCIAYYIRYHHDVTSILFECGPYILAPVPGPTTSTSLRWGDDATIAYCSKVPGNRPRFLLSLPDCQARQVSIL